MKSRNNKTPDMEIEKAKDYLLDSQKNIERLRRGKKPKRKIRFIISENKFFVFILASLVIFSAMIPLFIPNPPPVIADPFQNTVDATIYTINSNFTNDNSLPFNSHVETTPSSKLIILSSLAHSLLKQTDFVPINPDLFVRINYIEAIIENDSFVEYTNSSEVLSIDYQFLGIYSLLQAYHSTQGFEIALDLQDVYSTITKSLNKYYSEDLEMMLLPGSNVSYLIDQVISMFTIATFSIITEVGSIGELSIDSTLQNLLYSITENFYNETTDRFYHKFDLTTNTSSDPASVEELVFLDLGLSKSDKRFPYEFDYTFFSPYSIHQKISNEFVDDDWLVHNSSTADTNLLIKNQALFTLCSYMLRLSNVGDELLNATIEHFLTDDGFINSFTEQEITCESCLYGLIAIACEKWSSVQNIRENEALPSPTVDSSYPYLISLILIIFVLIRKRRKKKF